MSHRSLIIQAPRSHEQYNMGRLTFIRNCINSTSACWQPVLATTLHNRCRGLGVNDRRATKHVIAPIVHRKYKRMYTETTCRVHIVTAPRTSHMFGLSRAGMLDCVSEAHIRGNVASSSSRPLPTDPQVMRHLLHLRLVCLRRPWSA